MARARLILEDGTEYIGQSTGAQKERAGWIAAACVTSGFQEWLTEPASAGLILVSLYPEAGCSGMADEDDESRAVCVSGFAARHICDTPSNFRSTRTLSERLRDAGAPGISGIDTRALCRKLQKTPSLRGMITQSEDSVNECLSRLPNLMEDNLTARVSCARRWYARTPDHTRSLALIDLGAGLSLTRALCALSCNLTVLPYDSTAMDALSCRPDGIVIAGGPDIPAGAPALCESLLQTNLPLLALGTGCCALAQALGGKITTLNTPMYGAGAAERISDGVILSVWRAGRFGYEGGGETLFREPVTGVPMGFKSGRATGLLFHPGSGPEDARYLLSEFVKMTGGV